MLYKDRLKSYIFVFKIFSIDLQEIIVDQNSILNDNPRSENSFRANMFSVGYIWI